MPPIDVTEIKVRLTTSHDGKVKVYTDGSFMGDYETAHEATESLGEELLRRQQDAVSTHGCHWESIGHEEEVGDWFRCKVHEKEELGNGDGAEPFFPCEGWRRADA